MNAFKGIGIQHKKSGKIYSLDGWDSRGFDPDEVRGIAVGDGEHSLCLYKNVKSGVAWSYRNERPVPGVYTTEDSCSAKNDFDGRGNTEAVLKAVEDGLIEDAPAFRWVKETYGSEAYLPGLGELVMIVGNKNEIAECSNSICGNLTAMFLMSGWFPWASTQYSVYNAWFWCSSFRAPYYDLKSGGGYHTYALGCAAL